jgi:hypothetical protein
MKDIANFYVQTLIKSDKYNSPNPCKDETLLVPDFLDKLKASINNFNVKYSDVEVIFVETYRSNALQLIHFNNGASKIRKNGMHHYGIAVDVAFKINGKFTYNGDYKYLRECHTEQGLNLLGAWDIGHVQYVPVSEQQVLRNVVEQAVRKFQRDNGLVVDGEVGKKTIAKAKELYG